MKSALPFLLALVISCPAEAVHICWVERVAKHGEELHVFMKDQYISAVRKINLPDGARIAVNPNQDGSFTLHEGESAYLSTLPHDVCTAKAVAVDGALGLELNASVCMHMPGMGCQRATDFVVAE